VPRVAAALAKKSQQDTYRYTLLTTQTKYLYIQKKQLEKYISSLHRSTRQWGHTPAYSEVLLMQIGSQST
jgi:hypothetical protein